MRWLPRLLTKTISKATTLISRPYRIFTGARWAAESLMFLVSDTLRVGVVTGHIPVAKVAESITIEKILSKLKLMNASLQNDFWIRKPKIAVLGLKPPCQR